MLGARGNIKVVAHCWHSRFCHEISINAWSEICILQNRVGWLDFGGGFGWDLPEVGGGLAFTEWGQQSPQRKLHTICGYVVLYTEYTLQIHGERYERVQVTHRWLTL